jgi:hypothetical protein
LGEDDSLAAEVERRRLVEREPVERRLVAARGLSEPPDDEASDDLERLVLPRRFVADMSLPPV